MTFKTSDLAICAEVSQFTVRDYSDHGLLGPIPRSKSSSYRTFDPRQIPQIYLIRTLRALGYSPQQIREFGENRTPETVLQMFSDCSAQLSNEIAVLQAKLDQLQSYAALIREGQATQRGEVGIRHLQERAIRRSSLENRNGSAKSLESLRRAHGDIRHDGNAGCPLGYAFHNVFDLLEDPEQPAQLVSYDPQGPDIRPAGAYLVGTVNCHYSEKTSLPSRMYSYALQNNLELSGPAYTVYLLDSISVTEREQYLLQIAVKIDEPCGDAEGS